MLCRGGVEPPEIPFRCTVQLARQTWNIKPTKLNNVCDHLGITLKHHHAASDAEACALIVIAAHRKAAVSRSGLERTCVSALLRAHTGAPLQNFTLACIPARHSRNGAPSRFSQRRRAA